MATNEGRDPNDPRRPHTGDDHGLDPRPGPTTDPFGTRPGELPGDMSARGGIDDPARADPTVRTDYENRHHREDRMARPARGRSGTAWAWGIGAVVVIAAALAFFLSDGYVAQDVPVTGAIEEPIDDPAAPADPTRPIEAQ